MKLHFFLRLWLGCLWAGLWMPLAAQPLDLAPFAAMKARSIGPAGMSGRVTAIDVVRQQPDIIYAGTASGGLWRSMSGGIAWEPLFDTQRVASIGALAIYQKNPDIIWLGTGEGNPRNSQNSGYGVYRSLDGGRTWTCMGLEETRNIHRILIHPDDPNTVYVGAQGPAWGDSPHRGVYRTTDGGRSWDKILYHDPSTGIADLVMDPRNPNKLMAAMWEFRRWPWFFKSGGPGSGLHVTYDGGETWTRRRSQDGLPEGDLGRMGLAIAAGKPEVVYAYVESKKNALYRSDDGGFSFRKVSDDEGIGGRPFYYAEIYVDPHNENRLYSIHSTVTMSEDGGRSFRTLLGYVGSGGVHPDHHAWYIHPDDPSYIIDGNDGGMAISRDGGQNWQFVENLPLAQYYHINVDQEWPYNVYGGMQDNGSWVGPAYVWRRGGIRNSYFEELYFGDGFDVVPDPADSRYGFAMSQGGNLGRYDRQTGYTKFVRPVHPEGVRLRFHWNAAIAQDPFDPATFYYGSQFVHRTPDRGETWAVISPDLTTNDPAKQKQLESGGLTYDVTGAENHTTILAIAPSPVEKGLIWVGTDDGNLQLTRDGGATWTNLVSRLPGAPQNGWIPQIHPSAHAGGEAFVVLNNYRQNDWQPYLYHTRDYGQTWTRLADAKSVWGYCLSVVQDPEVPELVFLGTEYGLYVSIDRGRNWAKWTHGYPTVSTMDMVIHPRESDLVIGTFGRAAYVLDDIRPLRAVARAGRATLDRHLVVFPAPTAVQAEYAQASGSRFAADAVFRGENRRDGAMLSFWALTAAPDSGKKAKADSVSIEVLDASREVIRSWKVKPDSGLNRIYWGMDRKGVPYPRQEGGGGGRRGGNMEPSGGPVLPGTYTVRMTYRDQRDSTSVEVISDPRITFDPAHLAAMDAQRRTFQRYVGQIAEATTQLNQASKLVDRLNALLPKDDSSMVDSLRGQGKAMQDSIQGFMNEIFAEEDGKQGITDDPDALTDQLYGLFSYLAFSPEAPNANQMLALNQFLAKAKPLIARIDAFFAQDWQAYRELVEGTEWSPFRDVAPIGGED